MEVARLRLGGVPEMRLDSLAVLANDAAHHPLRAFNRRYHAAHFHGLHDAAVRERVATLRRGSQVRDGTRRAGHAA
eukprot:352983-Chlamydomonas_euryale.AAC.9